MQTTHSPKASTTAEVAPLNWVCSCGQESRGIRNTNCPACGKLRASLSPKAGERPQINPDLTAGDKVNVRNATLSGREIIEGPATIIKRVKQDRFMVRFVGDPKDETYERFVMPEHRI